MEKTAIFYPQQQMTSDSLNNIGEFAREGLDHIVHDAITSTTKFWNFPVAKTGPMEVTVGEGRLYYNGKVYARQEDNGVILSLPTTYQPSLRKLSPLRFGAKRLIALLNQLPFS
ncbi:hypothetical protein [Bartonella sp. DGB2]|uniref:hypothetical protein n=1 Tax=Bartonella sp. DGB2 TaxID=3388426 RepID=UPI00398FBB94